MRNVGISRGHYKYVSYSALQLSCFAALQECSWSRRCVAIAILQWALLLSLDNSNTSDSNSHLLKFKVKKSYWDAWDPKHLFCWSVYEHILYILRVRPWQSKSAVPCRVDFVVAHDLILTLLMNTDHVRGFLVVRERSQLVKYYSDPLLVCGN